jgi:hypothetical protein
MHPKMMTMLSNFHFTPSPLATAKPEPKISVTNQSMVIAPSCYKEHHPRKPRTSTFKSLAEDVPPFFGKLRKGEVQTNISPVAIHERCSN